MGWRPPPKDPEFGANCGDFPEGKTPRIFTAHITGIEFCNDIWPNGLVRPPMHFELVQRMNEPCTWDWTEGRWSATFISSWLGESSFNVTFDDVFYIFEAEEDAVSFGFNSSIEACQPFLNYGTGGSAHLVTCANTTAPSLTALCNLAGVPADIDTKCDVMPIDKDFGWVRFFRPDLQIHVHQKYTLLDIF